MVYLLYKFLFGFIIPIYRATRDVKKNFREMHERMYQQQGGQQAGQQQPASSPRTDEPGDYIDFEEVKD